MGIKFDDWSSESDYNKKMKKVYKYGTGEEIPEGAIYLSTIVGATLEDTWKRQQDSEETSSERKAVLVWHYFLVEVE